MYNPVLTLRTALVEYSRSSPNENILDAFQWLTAAEQNLCPACGDDLRKMMSSPDSREDPEADDYQNLGLEAR